MSGLTESAVGLLEQARRDRGVSWGELQRRTGIHEVTLRRVLKTRTQIPRDATLQLIADALGVELTVTIAAG